MKFNMLKLSTSSKNAIADDVGTLNIVNFVFLLKLTVPNIYCVIPVFINKCAYVLQCQTFARD